ncbi:MAG: insulinase family protein [Lactobacillaceae bacterium]|nr:insulinase family protein [Lactobacillaceae bacterium]
MKNITLNEGVYLHVVPTQQFATTQILINFSRSKSTADLAGRFLASNMAETASQDYPSQTKMAQVLSEMYGANFSADVLNVGAMHSLRFSLELVNDLFANDTQSLLADGFNFLHSVLTKPFGNAEQGFDVTVFTRQKEMALDEMAGLLEDREYQATRRAIDQFFGSSILATPGFGTEQQVESVSPLSAWQALSEALDNDRIDIVVQGAIDEEQVIQLARQFDFKARAVSGNPYFERENRPVKKLSLVENVTQARLVLGYTLKITHEQRFAGYVFNALFGGLGVSRLFLNVREKAGLSYSIYSDYNPFTSLMLVSAGLETADLAQTRALIAEQLADLQDHLISETELAMIKRLMINDFVVSLDKPGNIIERILTQQLTQIFMTDPEWVQQVNAVTAEDLRTVANALVLQVDLDLTEGGHE